MEFWIFVLLPGLRNLRNGFLETTDIMLHNDMLIYGDTENCNKTLPSLGLQLSGGNGQQEAERAVKKVANRLYKEGHICGELWNNLIPKHATQAKLKGNPKIHQEGNPMRTIVNGIGTATENMAGVAER